MLRAPLAAAVQWSSPTPSRPCSEGAVGRVYSSAQGNHGGAPAAGYIHMSNAGPQKGHGTLPQQPQPQAQPQAHQPQLGMVPCERTAQPTERERSEEQELERCKTGPAQDGGKGQLLSESSANPATTGVLHELTHHGTTRCHRAA